MKNIMIVEDEFIIALEIKIKLEKHGYEVKTVHNGEGAIDSANTNTFDLILMDILLNKGMDGIDAATHIRKKLQIPIVYLTGNTHLKNDDRLRATNPYAVLSKPVSDTELLDTINEAASTFYSD